MLLTSDPSAAPCIPLPPPPLGPLVGMTAGMSDFITRRRLSLSAQLTSSLGTSGAAAVGAAVLDAEDTALGAITPLASPTAHCAPELGLLDDDGDAAADVAGGGDAAGAEAVPLQWLHGEGALLDAELFGGTHGSPAGAAGDEAAGGMGSADHDGDDGILSITAPDELLDGGSALGDGASVGSAPTPTALPMAPYDTSSGGRGRWYGSGHDEEGGELQAEAEEEVVNEPPPQPSPDGTVAGGFDAGTLGGVNEAGDADDDFEDSLAEDSLAG